MSVFSVSYLPQSSILYLYSTKHEIQIDPDYQRMGEVWTLDKRQLLIDSILNGFDIPKIYFHEVDSPSARRRYRFAIVDGRQRLETIWSFIDGKYMLADDFKLLNDSTTRAEGLTYRELGIKYPRLKTLFDATTLTVVVVRTDDIDLIEEMFSRLNEAVPLNAAEKRNAFGGPLPKTIRRLAEHPFFKTRVRVSNRRYQHRDLAAKFLYLVHKHKIADTKKIYLDEFVKGFRKVSHKKVEGILTTVITVLDSMAKVFVHKDKLLRSAGMIVLYFLFFKELLDEGNVGSLNRSMLDNFEQARARNRETAEKDLARADYDLLEFDRLAQTPNDAYAIRLRLEALKKFLKRARKKR